MRLESDRERERERKIEARLAESGRMEEAARSRGENKECNATRRKGGRRRDGDERESVCMRGFVRDCNKGR